ncbi:MAG: VWA domain-containing protein [Balneolaceae bacterium]
MTWADPHFFWLLLLLPVVGGLWIWRLLRHRHPVLLFTAVQTARDLPKTLRIRARWIAPALYLCGLGLIILALARPQTQFSTVEQQVEGIEIVLSMDISSSMLAEDFEPNRLVAAKQIASDFVTRRTHDRVGINVFARQSFTAVPPTLDQELIQNRLQEIDVGMVQDGTAIGLGIATAINRLRESDAVSRIIILLTDGLNNAGEIDPLTAGELAATHNIRIYTIGVGTRGTAPYPIRDPVFGTRYQHIEVNIDEEMLTRIATMTGGRYFRATNTDELSDIYQEIDQLEQSEIDEIIYTDREDHYDRFLLPAVLLWMLALISEQWLFRPVVE